MPDRFTTVNLLDLFEQILEDYFVIDEESCVITISDSFASKLGYNPEELIGYSVACITPDMTRDWLYAAIKGSTAKTPSVRTKRPFLRVNQEEIELAIAFLPVIGENSRLYLIIDETETKLKS